MKKVRVANVCIKSVCVCVWVYVFDEKINGVKVCVCAVVHLAKPIKVERVAVCVCVFVIFNDRIEHFHCSEKAHGLPSNAVMLRTSTGTHTFVLVQNAKQPHNEPWFAYQKKNCTVWSHTNSLIAFIIQIAIRCEMNGLKGCFATED